MIRVGVGGWDYDPWRGTFFPDGLAKTKQLAHSSRRLTAIEVNGTFYSSQKPATFAKWAAETPDGFMFTLKASRYCVTRRVLAEAGESIERFLGQGITELGPKLGPILWQFAGTKKFDAEDFAAFLKLLPPEKDGLPLRHAVESRHESFRDPRFVDMCRAAGAAIVFAEDDDYPMFADVTGDFVYARLQRSREEEPTGYPAAELDRWAKVAREWAAGGQPDGLPYAGPRDAPERPRDVLVFFISGAKVRAPMAAEALIERVGR